MIRLEKALMILAFYVQALFLNLIVVSILEGLNRLVWIIFNMWIWCFVPILIVKYGNTKIEQDS